MTEETPPALPDTVPERTKVPSNTLTHVEICVWIERHPHFAYGTKEEREMWEHARFILYPIIPELNPHPVAKERFKPESNPGAVLKAFRRITGRKVTHEVLATWMNEDMPTELRGKITVTPKMIAEWESGKRVIDQRLMPVLRSSLNLGQRDYAFLCESRFYPSSRPWLASKPEEKIAGLMLQDFRERFHLTSDQLGEMTGIPADLIAEMEKATIPIDDISLKQIDRVFKECDASRKKPEQWYVRTRSNIQLRDAADLSNPLILSPALDPQALRKAPVTRPLKFADPTNVGSQDLTKLRHFEEMRQFGALLKMYCDHWGWTPKDLAERIGETPRMVYEWQQSLRPLDEFQLAKIIVAFDNQEADKPQQLQWFKRRDGAMHLRDAFDTSNPLIQDASRRR